MKYGIQRDVAPPFFDTPNWVTDVRRMAANLIAYGLYAGRLYRRTDRSWSIVAQNSLMRRFLVGARLGDLISTYLHSGTPSLPWRLRLSCGDVFGLWSVAVIALDSAVDTDVDNREAAVALTDDVAHILFDPTPVKRGDASESRADAVSFRAATALRLCSVLRREVDALMSGMSPFSSHELLTMARKNFSALSLDLLLGALRSLEQSSIDRRHDWAWYCREVLDQKTLNFFLAPSALFCITTEAVERYEHLRRLFITLNSGYSHWQLLDDIADLPEDTEAGLITAPGYILLSQGTLAKLCSFTNFGSETVDWIRQSLLLSPLCAGPAWREGIHMDVVGEGSGRAQVTPCEELARMGLANTRDDLTASIPLLCSARLQQAKAFVDALHSGEAARALSAIVDSGVTVRLLEAVHDEERLSRVRSDIRAVHDPALVSVLRSVDALMARALAKAIASAEGVHK